MPKENIQDVYAQLQGLVDVDFDAMLEARNARLNYLQKMFVELEKKIVDNPSVAAEKVCQYIRDDKLKNTKGFAFSIFRMLQTGKLDVAGLQKIIETIKDHHRLK